MANAVVHLLDVERQRVTGTDGRVCLENLAPGEHEILVVADGYSVLDTTLSLPAVSSSDAARQVIFELTPAFGEELVVTGTRTARKLVDSPVHVRQVTRATIDASASRTLADAIELTPGVRIESNCQNCNFSQVRMLGLEGPYSQVLVDGQPTVSSLALVYGIEQFPARALESIEVVKGGGAALYGAGAVGGVINLIPHSPLDTHATLDFRASETGGEPGYSASALADWSPRERRTGVSLLAQLDDVEPADLDGDGFTEVTSRELTTLGLRAEHYLLGDRARLDGEVNWTDAQRRGGDLARFDLPPEETALTEEIATERLGLSLGYLHTLSSRLDVRLAASYADTRRASYYGAGFDPDAYGSTENPLWIVDAQLNRRHDRGTWSGGASYSRDELDDRQPGYGRLLRETHTNLGVYLQDDRTLADRVTVVYGLRVDDHSALPDPVASPRLAAMLSPRDDLTIRASYAQGFRAPVTFDEDLHIELAGGAARVVLPSTDLVEERSEASLLSLEWRPTFGRRAKGSASLELAAFRTDLDELFDVVERDDPRTPQREFLRVNAEGARVEGVELAASVRWGSRLSAELGFVVQSARYDVPEPDFGARRFLRTPDEHGTLSLQARLPAALDLFVGARYTGSMLAPHYAGFIAEDRLETTPSFFEIDVNLSRTVALGGHEVTVTVGGKNLTDAYQRDLDQGPDRDSNYVYGPRLPRSVTVGLRWEL
ncbi:MAG: TonB-dependent receptor [Acidobacteriota bacterium]